MAISRRRANILPLIAFDCVLPEEGVARGFGYLRMDIRDILISIKGLLRFFVTHDNGFTYVWPRQVIMEWWVPGEG